MRVTNRLVTVLFVILLATLSGCASGASALKTVVIGVPVLIVGGVLNGLGDDSEDLLGIAGQQFPIDPPQVCT